MGEYYLKAEHHVTVMGSGDIRELHDRLQDTQASVEGYRGILTKQAEEMVELRDKFTRMEEELEALKARDEAREPYDDKMTRLMKRLFANPEMKELIREEMK